MVGKYLAELFDHFSAVLDQCFIQIHVLKIKKISQMVFETVSAQRNTNLEKITILTYQTNKKLSVCELF